MPTLYLLTSSETVDLIGALAWPAVTLAMFWLLRHQIRDLFRRPEGKVKIGPFEAEWSRVAQEVKEELPAKPEASPTRGVVDDIWPLIQRDPQAAVLEGRGRLELILRRRLNVYRDETNTPLPDLVRKARRRRIITRSTEHAINGLIDLGNLAAHGQKNDVTKNQASEYLTLVNAVYGEVATWVRPENPDSPN